MTAALMSTPQLGAFSHLENAEQLRERFSHSHAGVSVVPTQAKDARYYRVQLGSFVNRSVAEARAHQLSQAGLPVIVRDEVGTDTSRFGRCCP
jgi:cell division protein FtsN